MSFFVFLVMASLALTRADPRIISYEDLMLTANRFSDPSVTSYSQLLFDISRSQIIVGARDALFRLSLKGLDRLEKAAWFAAPNKTTNCQEKGQSEENCHNFIKVLLTNGKRLLTCGTGAFSPECSWRDMEDVSRATDWVSGVAKCPYSPDSNVTALLSETTGQYFAASPMDFSGTYYAITRSMGQAPNITTDKHNPKLLNDPQFVGSFETDKFVYFLFREIAVEYINCGKVIYSRIARVCKNDKGGQHWLRDNWTTFIKARLNCSLPGEYPFYFDNIQGMTYLPEQGVIYATFTTPTNSIPGSAVCAFNMTAVETAFNGPFKHQKSMGSAWERHVSLQSTSHFQCRYPHPSNQDHLRETYQFQLMDSAVQPTTLRPLYNTTMEILTHIAVHVTSTKLHKDVHVLFVANTEGLIKKISVIDRTQETCVLEVWKPFPHSAIRKIHTLKFAMESLYIGTEEAILRVPGEHCRRHKSRSACINSMDPYCGWEEHAEHCIPPPNDNPLASYWHQEATHCPTFSHPVDGDWSAWSEWSPCQHYVSSGGSWESSSSGSNSSGVGPSGGDTCLCSTRTCDNPRPAHRGLPCSGVSVRVANCTVHGGWSSWSGWSACSQTCGIALKTRRRTCGNPAPQFGGRVCVGKDRSDMYCHSNPPCPVDTAPVQDGNWGSWGAWSECSAPCGGGFRVRSRSCSNPPPQGGDDCIGCPLEYQTCHTAPCIESRKLSSWTTWLPAGNNSEKRFRFACRVPTPDPDHIKISLFRVGIRNCTSEGICSQSDRSETEDSWSEWSIWSPCSAECGEGQQHRLRICEGRPEDCPGLARISRLCNAGKCKGEWGCWSDWSECSASCGSGMRQRARSCLYQQQSLATEADGCVGSPIEQESCHVASCDSFLGWDSWSVWSPCDPTGYQHRTRMCHTSNPGPDMCQGYDSESRICPDYINEAALSQDVGSVSVATVVVCSLVAFMAGGLAVCLGWLYAQRRRGRGGPRVPGSPHYISSKQNPYVTVPLKEMHSPKRTPSLRGAGGHGGAASGALGGASTPKLFSKGGVGGTSGTTPEYETATIKRNSHSLANGHLRADLDQDKFF